MIASSSFTVEHAQIDGRFYVTETLVDDAKNTILFTYLADQDTDPEQVMKDRVAELNVDGEILVEVPVDVVLPRRTAAVDTLVDTYSVLSAEEKEAVKQAINGV